MIWYKILFFGFFFSISMPLSYSNLSHCSDYPIIVDAPVEKIKPREKKQKRSQQKRWKQEQIKSQKRLKRPALICWFTFVIFALSLVIMSGFLIGLGIIPWSIALYLMLGADIAAFLTLVLVLFVDVPEFPDVMAFVAGLFSWAFLNVIMGLAFLIWGLAISWIFGWMIGLILLGLGVLFLAIYFIATRIQAKKDEQEVSE